MMKIDLTNLNLVVGWLGMLLGFGSGFALGLNFHRENWLGGYASYRRRLYRLAHISFFGLAMINLFFHFTSRSLALTDWRFVLASWGFVAGAVSMPICCVIMAHNSSCRALFLIPVVSLVSGGFFTLLAITKL